MKIAILGYGKMGKAIEAAASERGHTVGLRVSSANADFVPADLAGHDVAIEFSRPESVVGNVLKCFDADLPVVIGTTGWYDRFEELKKTCEKKGQAMLPATNFSIGVHLFFSFNKYIAKAMSHYKHYDVAIEEIHHTQKLDAPSGTAITLAEGLIENRDEKTEWINESTHLPHQLGIVSKRIENVPGTHTVRYRSEIDSIELKHTAHNRKGFATGSVVAAEWLKDRKGVFAMSDVLNLS